jgi:CopG family transcriptional regulator / antitoxin EndoAI
MSLAQSKRYRRINITLPPQTLMLVDRLAEKGDRSRLIDEAVRYYVKEMGRARLRQQLQAGAVQRAKRDRILAEEWFEIESELLPPHPL